MSETFIFGYGSLVNRATHDYGAAHLAELSGWRREWRYTTLREVAFLNAIPDPDSSIKGVILGVPPVEPELDRREHAYDRIQVSAAVAHTVKQPVDINIFALPPKLHHQNSGAHSILLSYVDVVVQGYFRAYGEAGVQEFFETTTGWGAPILNDRAAPVYSRHQRLDAHEVALTDHWPNALTAVVKQL